jgi:uncharacterized repeat protein (TIGR01451 family)
VIAGIAVGQFAYGLAIDPSRSNLYVGQTSDGELLVVGPPTPAADVALDVTAPPSAADGSRFDEVATVTNHGPATATGIVTNLIIPTGLTRIASPGASVSAGTLIWWQTSLAPGASVSYSAIFKVAGDFHATVSIGGVTIAATEDADHADNVGIAGIRLG